MPLRPSWRSARRSSGSSIVVVSFGEGATLEQVAVEGELADERVDLAQREGRGRVALEVDGAGAERVVAEGGRRERLEMRSLVGKHRGDLPLGGAVDARVGPAGIPVIEVGLGVLEALEAQALERRALGVPDPRLDFP